MGRIPLLVLLLLAAALPAAAQTTRPAADSIRMAEVESDAEVDTAAVEEAEEDSVPRRKPGPYARSRGTGPFTVQASGQVAARAPRPEVVWIAGRRPAAADSSRRDTARVASGQAARRDTAGARRQGSTPAAASATRPAPRDTARIASGQAARRDTARTRPAPRDTARRQGSAAAAAPRPTNARPRTHTVAAGETFFAIARRYGVTSAQLRALNPDVDIQAIEIGDVLRLPASARDSRASAGAQRTGTQPGGRTPPAATRRTHTVAAGETLYGIARRYGVTVGAIREANEMESDQVRTGQRLVIPPAR